MVGIVYLQQKFCSCHAAGLAGAEFWQTSSKVDEHVVIQTVMACAQLEQY